MPTSLLVIISLSHTQFTLAWQPVNGKNTWLHLRILSRALKFIWNIGTLATSWKNFKSYFRDVFNLQGMTCRYDWSHSEATIFMSRGDSLSQCVRFSKVFYSLQFSSWYFGQGLTCQVWKPMGFIFRGFKVLLLECLRSNFVSDETSGSKIHETLNCACVFNRCEWLLIYFRHKNLLKKSFLPRFLNLKKFLRSLLHYL